MNEVSEYEARQDATIRLDASTEYVKAWVPEMSISWLKRAIAEAGICVIALNEISPKSMEMNLCDCIDLSHLPLCGVPADVARKHQIWAVDDTGLALVGKSLDTIVPLREVIGDVDETIKWVEKGEYIEGYCGNACCFEISPSLNCAMKGRHFRKNSCGEYKLCIKLPIPMSLNYNLGQVDELKITAKKRLMEWMERAGMQFTCNCVCGGKNDE